VLGGGRGGKAGEFKEKEFGESVGEEVEDGEGE